MSRKTIDVERVKQAANTFLAAPDSFSTTDNPAAQRLGVAGLLEMVLHATGNYRGFRYLDSEYLPADQQTSDQVLRTNYDETRRRYL